LEEIDMDAYERVMDVNALGPVRVTRAVLSNLRAGQLRKIVNITSTLGSIARNTSGSFYGYRESKAALNMFTKSLAADLGPEGFTCIVLHPGWVCTDDRAGLGPRDTPRHRWLDHGGQRLVLQLRRRADAVVADGPDTACAVL
jgi:NAD(P)-dependent dehydrogenase (short-subunit alcohol dehydrogenase family)